MRISLGLTACIIAASFVAASVIRADTPLKLELTRDTWVSAVGQEQDSNNGGSSRLKLKGIQEFSIIDIDPKPLRGKTILNAELHVKNASPEKLGRVTVSSLTSDWVEGTSADYAHEKGASSFRWAQQDERPWSFPGSDISSVFLSQGGTIWGFADAISSDAQGWQVIPIRPRVLGTRVAGVSHGFVLMDDIGSEYDHKGNAFKWKLFPNRFIYSHEQSNGRPYMIVLLGPDDHAAPESPTALRQLKEILPPGEAIVEWLTPPDRGPSGVAGFVVRYAEGDRFDWDAATPLPQYLVPAALHTGDPAQMHLRDLNWKPGQRGTLGIRAIDSAGNLSDVATLALTASDQSPALILNPPTVKPFTEPGKSPKVANLQISIIDALDKVQPVTGAMLPAHDDAYLQANHLWSAATKTVRLFAAKNEFVDFQIVLKGAAKSIDARLSFDDPEIRTDLFRFRQVATKAGPMPDPLVPSTPFALPATDESIDAQTRAAMIADVYVPHSAKPGLHHGALTLTADGESTQIAVDLHVWDFTLPDVLSFIPEMNSYGLPDDDELAYYRLAHAHRTNLNRLGYNWRGIPADRCAPKWDGARFDWTEYDRHYAPLLDGSAFADLPRKSIPVDGFYLPLNENWPLDVNAHFKGGYWADRAFDPEYEKGFTSACAQFAKHIQDKGWTHPVFEFYLNNKVYFKNDNWSKCSAPWCFDEPVNAQDFWALRYFGQLFQNGVAPYRGAANSPNIGFRCDISYPQWQRDFLDGILDVNVCGGAFRQYHRLVMDRKRRSGEVTFNYGSSNPIEDPNTQPAAWCLDTWCLGGDGVLPWQTIGTADSWKTADPLSLFYPPLPNTHDPVASIRLKSYRRGQQDVEYLTLLQQVTSSPRFAVAAAARDALKLGGTVQKQNEEDAGVVNYGQIDPATLWALRLRVGAMLDQAHLAASNKLLDLRPMRRGSIREINPVQPRL